MASNLRASLLSERSLRMVWNLLTFINQAMKRVSPFAHEAGPLHSDEDEVLSFVQKREMR